MTKKLFVVLVVGTALLLAISWAIAAKRGAQKEGLQKFEPRDFVVQETATPVPLTVITEPLAPSMLDQSNQAFDGVLLGGPFAPAGPGDMLWCCPCSVFGDFRFLGVEYFRDTVYVTGAGQSSTDGNYVDVWLATGTDVCTWLYRHPETATSAWGWRDLACDGQYLYGSESYTLEAFYMTPAALVRVPAMDIPNGPISPWRAVAYDAGRDAFWTASFSSNIYCVDRNSNIVAGPFANTYPLYGMAYDGTWLWCHSQDNTKIYQFDPNAGVYTGVVYSGCQDATGGIAGGLSMMSFDEGKQTLTVIGLTQGTPDAFYATEIPMGGPVGCCEYAGTCDEITEDSCTALGGTWYPDLQCIGDECTLPIDTLCHMQWDNGSGAYYSSGFQVNDQQGNYFDPEAMCPDCGPDVYPFLVSQVSGLIYDHAGAGYVDVIVHLYAADPDSCAGPGAELYSFGPVTVTTFYPNEVVLPLPEVFCVNEDFFATFEYVNPSSGIPCLLWTSEPGMADCISWLWYNTYSPPWHDNKGFWTNPGYIMLRVDGVCNSGVCGAEPVPCDLVQEGGNVSSYFSGLGDGDVLAKYFDPFVYCEEPVYPYKIHDVDMYFYDFAGVGTVDIRIDVHVVCHDSCDGPGTRIYQSDPITVTDFYPDMAHIDLPEQVCVFEPFFISIEWVGGTPGTIPSFLMESDAYPCDTCHAWMYYPSGGAPFWIEWSDFWSPPPPGCPIIRVTGFTEHPDCDFAPCDTTMDTLFYHASYAAWVWTIPDAYGDDFFNERFILPAAYGGRLDEFHISFYQAALVGTPDADIYVWLSDGMFPLDNNPPYQAIAQFQIPYANLVWYPGWNVVQMHDYGIEFDPGEMFHVGYSHADHVNDVLACLSDNADGSGVEQSSECWNGIWGTMLADWGLDVDFLMEAVICIEAPPGSTFTMDCSPFQANATPGDPPVDLYTVDVGAILGYPLNVTLSCTPPAGINVGFNPNAVPPPFISDVSVSVDVGTAYGDYLLTLVGTGADGQVKSCDVVLTVQPPFDECEVPFFHGMQRGSNFGAIGNDVRDNFVWYGMNMLFDGSFIVATTEPWIRDHMALDVFNCVNVGWLPTGHTDEYYDPVYNANICYGNFFAAESVISCEWDSVYIIGIMDTCVDFSIKVKIYYNPTTTPIPELWMALYEDWDVGNAYDNWMEMDTLHNLMWQWDPADPDLVFGTMKAPFYDELMHSMVGVNNAYYVWPNAGFCDSTGEPGYEFYGLDSLYALMTTPGYRYPTYINPDSNDISLLMTAPPISLNPGEKHIEIWIDFGRNLQDGLTWDQWWHRVLRYAGFYRGDVNASDTLELPALDVSDLVYLVQWLFQNGPDPIPYVDQGDVNGDRVVNVADVVYLINWVFGGSGPGPPPVDYVRFIDEYWWRWSLFLNPNW